MFDFWFGNFLYTHLAGAAHSLGQSLHGGRHLRLLCLKTSQRHLGGVIGYGLRKSPCCLLRGGQCAWISQFEEWKCKSWDISSACLFVYSLEWIVNESSQSLYSFCLCLSSLFLLSFAMGIWYIRPTWPHLCDLRFPPIQICLGMTTANMSSPFSIPTSSQRPKRLSSKPTSTLTTPTTPPPSSHQNTPPHPGQKVDEESLLSPYNGKILTRLLGDFVRQSREFLGEGEGFRFRFYCGGCRVRYFCNGVGEMERWKGIHEGVCFGRWGCEWVSWTAGCFVCVGVLLPPDSLWWGWWFLSFFPLLTFEI